MIFKKLKNKLFNSKKRKAKKLQKEIKESVENILRNTDLTNQDLMK